MDFDFNVKGNTGYMELTFTAENVHASSGLLDEVESVELAAKLIYAAEELLSAGFGESEHKLREIRESLESG